MGLLDLHLIFDCWFTFFLKAYWLGCGLCLCQLSILGLRDSASLWNTTVSRTKAVETQCHLLFLGVHLWGEMPAVILKLVNRWIA